MIDHFKRLADILVHHARGVGKTHNLATMTAAIGGTIIVRNAAEAERVRKAYSVRTMSFEGDLADRLRGTPSPVYVDPDAVGRVMYSLIGVIEQQRHDLQDRHEENAELRVELERLKQRVYDLAASMENDK